MGIAVSVHLSRSLHCVAFEHTEQAFDELPHRAPHRLVIDGLTVSLAIRFPTSAASLIALRWDASRKKSLGPSDRKAHESIPFRAVRPLSVSC